MRVVDDYLHTLKEDLRDKIVKWLEDIDLRQATLCKRIVETESYIYLYHSTRPQYVPQIKSEGITLSYFTKRAEEEGDIPVGDRPMIILSNIRTTQHQRPATPGFGFGWPRKKLDKEHGLVHVICKVKTDPSVLMWSTGCCYYYLEDIPPSELMWEGTREFEAIEGTNNCLVQKHVGEL